MPSPMQHALNPFAQAAIEAVAQTLDLAPDLFSASAPPRPDMGDFAVGCFPAARAMRQAPPKIAARVVEAFEPGEFLAEARAAGPFVNFRANRPNLYRYLFAGTLGGGSLVPDVGAGKTVCIDYSSPNISKHLAYHHIRSTVIGQALANLYRGLGYRVVGINHLGDWGTTHGMLLAAYDKWGAPEPLTITGLNDLYVRFRQAMSEDDSLEALGRAWFKKLEDGDEAANALWRRFREVSLAEFQEVYDLLGVEFQEIKGESEYLDDVPAVMKLLEDKGLLADSQGAVVVPPPDGDDRTPPMLLKKKDGATLYGTRDLAAAMYRFERYDFVRSLYVVDRGQSLHFRQLFDALVRAGKDWAEKCEHVPFGLVRLGGIKTGTRTGNVVLLKDVLAEAIRRAEAVVADNSEKTGADMDGETMRAVAEAVGIGAVVFANLSSQRGKDVDFEWEQVLSTTGDSGPYVQYAHARCASILRKAANPAEKDGARGLAPDPSDGGTALTEDLEWAVARKLLDFAEIVQRAGHGNEPHLVSRYLLDLCAVFSRWYTSGNQDRSLRVLVDDPEVSRARLTLVAAVKGVLAQGLGMLCVRAPDSM